MKTAYRLLISSFVAFVILSSVSIIAQDKDVQNNSPMDSLLQVVVPNNYSSTPGTVTFAGPFSTSQRRYQLLIHEDQLTSLIDANLTSINFRIPASATTPWPASALTIASYGIYLGASVPPANRSLTFADNIAGPQTMVRAGALEINAEAYPSGGSPNLWGPDIEFQTPYPYSGGHLLIEIQHFGFTGTSRSNDAIGTSITGYGTMFSACWASSVTAVTALQGNFAVLKINGLNIIPVELTSFTAHMTGEGVELKWETASETNNRGFEIERSDYSELAQEEWLQVGFVEGNGTTSITQSYNFIDNSAVSGKYLYRLKQIDLDGTINYSNKVEVDASIPNDFVLYQNYPNPFNPTTTIKFALPTDSKVLLEVFNVMGKKVKTLINSELKSGYHNYEFNANTLSSGIYFYKLNAGKFSSIKKLILLK
ncbi:MAG: T9SS type A sorting domain-containing protein [Ignavibacteria bacterium]|nr:T9SS type A sorting domain-containing protein [Ignavibacteria bacterium]